MPGEFLGILNDGGWRGKGVKLGGQLKNKTVPGRERRRFRSFVIRATKLLNLTKDVIP